MDDDPQGADDRKRREQPSVPAQSDSLQDFARELRIEDATPMDRATIEEFADQLREIAATLDADKKPRLEWEHVRPPASAASVTPGERFIPRESPREGMEARPPIYAPPSADSQHRTASGRSRRRTLAAFLVGVATGGVGVYLLTPANPAPAREVEPIQSSVRAPIQPPAAPPSIESSAPAESTPPRRNLETPQADRTETPVGLSGRRRDAPTPIAPSSVAASGSRARTSQRAQRRTTPSQLPQERRPQAPARVTERDVAGSPATNSGSLWLISVPAGASVYLDERLYGRTPIAIPDVSEGTHAVRLEHDEYRSWTSQVRIQAGRRQRLTIALDPASP